MRSNIKEIIQMFVLGLLLILSGFGLEACDGKKKKNHGGPGGAPIGSVYNNYGGAGCSVPGGVTQVLRSSLGAGSVLTIYVVRQGPNQIILYGDLMIPDVASFGGVGSGAFGSCLVSSSIITTYTNGNTVFENFANNAVLSGNGVAIEVLSGGYTYLVERSMLGQVRLEIPAIGYTPAFISLTGI